MTVGLKFCALSGAAIRGNPLNIKQLSLKQGWYQAWRANPETLLVYNKLVFCCMCIGTWNHLLLKILLYLKFIFAGTWISNNPNFHKIRPENYHPCWKNSYKKQKHSVTNTELEFLTLKSKTNKNILKTSSKNTAPYSNKTVKKS